MWLINYQIFVAIVVGILSCKYFCDRTTNPQKMCATCLVSKGTLKMAKEHVQGNFWTIEISVNIVSIYVKYCTIWSQIMIVHITTLLVTAKPSLQLIMVKLSHILLILCSKCNYNHLCSICHCKLCSHERWGPRKELRNILEWKVCVCHKWKRCMLLCTFNS